MTATIPRTPDEHRLWWAENTDQIYGFCWCGCGLKTQIASSSKARNNAVRGCPRRFVHTHNSRVLAAKNDRAVSQAAAHHRRAWRRRYPDIDYGLCCCGCGNKTPLAQQTDTSRGHVQGEPKLFIAGHNARLQTKRFGCSVTGCERPHSARGLCKHHYVEWLIAMGRRQGKPSCQYRFEARNGYVYVRNPTHPNAHKNKGIVAQHVAIMSAHLGRALYSHEEVHHRNGVRSDNYLKNLELWTTSHPRGQRVEDKIRWAREFLAQYE